MQIWEIDGIPTRVVHHGIARYYPYPRQLRRHIRFEMPVGATEQDPNFLDAVLEDQNALEYLRGGPGGYIPWDWSVYYWCRAKFEIVTTKAFEARVERHRKRIEAAQKAWQDDIAYRMKQVEPYLLRQADKLSESDWAQLRARQHRQAVAKRLGLPPEALRDRNPYLTVQAPKSAPPVIWSPQSTETYGRVAPAQESRT